MPSPPNPTHPHSRGRAALLALGLIVAIVAPLWHLHIIGRDFGIQQSDLQAVRIGVHTLWSRGNPYSSETTGQIQVAYYGRTLPLRIDVNQMSFAYPVTTALVLAPLAWLSFDQAQQAFLLIMPILTVASILLWLRVTAVRISVRRTFVVVVLIMASWPVVWALRLQQPTLVVAVLLAASCFLLIRDNGISAGILLGLATIKPQLTGPLVAWLMLWAVSQRRWRFLTSFAATLGALLLGAQTIDPGWIAPWRRAGIALIQENHQQTMLERLIGPLLATPLTVAAVAACILILVRLRRSAAGTPEFGAAIALSLAATVALLPTGLAMAYNDILLIPAVLILIHCKPSGDLAIFSRIAALMSASWILVACPIAVLGETLSHPSMIWDNLPFFSPLFPLLATMALLALAAPRANLVPTQSLIPHDSPAALAG